MVEGLEKAYHFIEKSIKENKKISHAYLIETNGHKDYMTFVKNLMITILNNNIEDVEQQKKIELSVLNDNYPDIKYIYADGDYIKKEQLITLEKEFSKKSMLDNKLIYVIDGVEKLNDSSANTILKFLEEPEEDIVAILVTNNRYKVIETILSRCQIITLTNNLVDIESNDYITDFFKDLIITKKLIINYDLYLENLFSDRSMAINTLNTIELLFYNYLNGYSISDDIKLFLDKIETSKILNYILVISQEKSKLDYNLNMKLWLTNLMVCLVEE